LQEVLEFGDREGLSILGLIRSPLKGPKGNIEFLAHFGLNQGKAAVPLEDFAVLIDEALKIEAPAE
jgi:hypothetical protein